MQLAYIARRFGVFLLIVWLAASLNFFLPKLSGQDPVRTKLLQSAQLGGYVHAGLEDMVKEYDQRFGLDKPLWQQYLTYLRATARLDFNYSIANYPRTVREMVGEAVPWTVDSSAPQRCCRLVSALCWARCSHGRGRHAGCAG